MKALAVLGGMALLACASQADATIYIGLDDGSGSGIKTVAVSDASGTVSISNYLYGGFSTSITSQGYPLLDQPALQTTSINTTRSDAGSLTIYVTQTDLSSYTGDLSAYFTANQPIDPSSGNYLGDGAATVTETAYYDTGNGLFTGTEIGNATFTSQGSGSASTGYTSITGPFSETTKYVVSANTASGASLNDTINLAGAVPEPATWAMMLAGFGLIGASLRQRRRAAVSFG